MGCILVYLFSQYILIALCSQYVSKNMYVYDEYLIGIGNFYKHSLITMVKQAHTVIQQAHPAWSSLSEYPLENVPNLPS